MDKILIIDTSSNERTKVGLSMGGKLFWEKQESGKLHSQVVLPLIDKILKSNHITLKNITGIKVNKGPGSFTGIRVGIAIANALGFALKIPVNGKKVGKIETPSYEETSS